MSKPYERVELGEYIVADQSICHGQPTFKGTRKMVHLVLLCFGERGKTVEDIAAAANLPVEALEEALKIAASAVRDYLSLPDPHPEESPTLGIPWDETKPCSGHWIEEPA